MFDHFWQEIPPVTRIIMTLQIMGLAIHSVGYVDRYDLYFNFDKIVWEGQIWRLFTCFFFIKKINIYSFFQIMFFYQILKNLERGLHKGSIDFLFLMILLSTTLEIFAVIFTINHLGVIFKYAIYYLYGRSNQENVIMVNFMLIRAPYLIWFIFFFDWLLDTPDLKSMVLSIFVGHSLYFFLKVYPNLHYAKGKRPLDSPAAFVDLVAPFFREEDRAQQQIQNWFG